MVVKYKPTFTRDFNKIKDIKDKKEIYRICFEDAIEAKRISGIKNLKKIKGYRKYYRIRQGDYRIGLKYEDGEIVFMRVLKRDVIYRYFP